MIIFKGELIQYPNGTAYYQFRAKDYDDPMVEYISCSGFAIDLIRGDTDRHGRQQEYAWGYDGEGPQLLSAIILGAVLRGKDESWPLDYNYVDSYSSHLHRKRRQILSLYQDFCAEVIANLPDKWTMTDKEVLAWIKKKEALAVST